MGDAPDWSGKSADEVEALRANAERALADPKRAAQHARARAILDSLPPPKSRAVRARGGGRADTATAAAVARLTEVARTLREEFDLSPPEGTPNPHKLTAADGTPKVGGRQRAREVAADRYLSYRRGDTVVVLGWLRRHDEDAATGGGWYAEYGGVPDAEQPEEAAALASFRDRLAALAPRRHA